MFGDEPPERHGPAAPPTVCEHAMIAAALTGFGALLQLSVLAYVLVVYVFLGQKAVGDAKFLMDAFFAFALALTAIGAALAVVALLKVEGSQGKLGGRRLAVLSLWMAAAAVATTCAVMAYTMVSVVHIP